MKVWKLRSGFFMTTCEVVVVADSADAARRVASEAGAALIEDWSDAEAEELALVPGAILSEASWEG